MLDSGAYWRWFRKQQRSTTLYRNPLRLLSRPWHQQLLAQQYAQLPTISEACHRLVNELTRSIQRLATPQQYAAIQRLLAQPCYPWDIALLAWRVWQVESIYRDVLRKKLGLGPASWLREKRLNHAIYLLQSTDLPLADIASPAVMSMPLPSDRHYENIAVARRPIGAKAVIDVALMQPLHARQ